jgi:hypothetical protein
MISFSGSVFEALKASIKPGKCPSNPTLRKVEDFLMEYQRDTFDKSKVLLDLDDIALDFLVECGISEQVVVTFRNIPGFLVNVDSIVRVWNDRSHTNYITYRKDTPEWKEFESYNTFDSDTGQYYTIDNLDQYYDANSSGQLKPIRGLRWKLPNTEECGQCHRKYRREMMLLSGRLGSRVCKWCDVVINQYEHPRQDPAHPITAYHSHRASWVFYPVRKDNEQSIPMGVELEMHSKLGNSLDGAVQSARNILLDTTTDYPNYYFETDGSLSEGGFEMITNPMTLEFGREWWGKMLPIIRKYCVGYNAEKQIFGAKHCGGSRVDTMVNYGIHITVSRIKLPSIVLPKLQRFFDNKINAEFIQAIAQRNVMYGGYWLGSKDKPQAKDVIPWVGKNINTIKTMDRRSPINIKGISRGGETGLVEFRMFRSTLNTMSFLKNLEFIDGITSYYKEQLGMNTDYRNFIGYVIDNRRRYPNLIAYLQHPRYFVKGVGIIKNEWLPMVEGIVFKKYDPLKEYGPPVLSNTDATDVLETAAA